MSVFEPMMSAFGAWIDAFRATESAFLHCSITSLVPSFVTREVLVIITSFFLPCKRLVIALRGRFLRG